MNGHITLDRKILEWEWYANINTCRLFIHLLLKASWKDTRWQGRIIKRGQLVTSIPTLSEETFLTQKEVRVALNHLIETGEVGRQTTNKYSVITVIKYDEYQPEGSQRADKGQANGQSNDKQMGSQRADCNAVTTRDSGDMLSEMGSQRASERAGKRATSEEYKKEEIYISCANDSHDRETKTIDERKKYNFEIIYKAYPKKVGKQGALDHYLGWISAKGRCINGRYRRLTNEQIFAAVKKYVKQMQDEEKELQFYQGFDRFMNKTILDYVEDT